jgi:hypothetical protein
MEFCPFKEVKYSSISAKDFPLVSGIFQYMNANPMQLMKQNSQNAPYSFRFCSRYRYDMEAVNMDT